MNIFSIELLKTKKKIVFKTHRVNLSIYLRYKGHITIHIYIKIRVNVYALLSIYFFFIIFFFFIFMGARYYIFHAWKELLYTRQMSSLNAFKDSGEKTVYISVTLRHLRKYKHFLYTTSSRIMLLSCVKRVLIFLKGHIFSFVVCI